jgi:hypothetical protein
MDGPLMRTRYLQYLANILALSILSAVAIRNSTQPDAGLEILGIVVGAAMLVWQILKVIKSVRRDTSRYAILKSGTGSVRVHASAVEEALRRTARSLPEVYDARIRLQIDPQTHTPEAGDVDARLSDITNIVSIHDTLSRVLTERYQQIIPGAPYLEFHLTFKHHFGGSKPKRKRDKQVVPPEEDETKAIRAPLYPVPDDKE